MYCANCGSEIPDGSVFCPKCGVSTSSQIPENDIPARQRAPKSIGGFICGLLGFLLDLIPVVGLVLSIVGASLCGNGKRLIASKPDAYEGGGLLTAGQVLSIIGIVVSSITLIATIVSLVIGGGFLLFNFDDLLDLLDL
mgnify:CR=1 FL=1